MTQTTSLKETNNKACPKMSKPLCEIWDKQYLTTDYFKEHIPLVFLSKKPLYNKFFLQYQQNHRLLLYFPSDNCLWEFINNCVKRFTQLFKNRCLRFHQTALR